mmetsp:Transcript_43402/g.87778  ORF Transcript_43402/g.87778 Transcript_43402/m.87778 type:complete len:114 (+) Transcript_43402:42-383(+)|eukprot:CAMPEP_0171624522 /NCGR_PEP_ID=MMETSP0990-20121206/18679_1 /TAXON_ID=483369 /ORGANISM="non described non described, Strain CCMP2098" /LENGTH=113 /DNA_ID=CAMNT_0012191107 /DNA_START=78 /DNA_END=419 /DNA_ORIENTATION=+
MFSKVFAILALVGGASAFAPLAVPARAIRAAPVEAMKPMDMAKAVAVAAIVASPLLAGATEGTNEIFGVNYDKIFYFSIPTVAVGHFLGLAFNDWEKDQSNEDFFDEIAPPNV